MPKPPLKLPEQDNTEPIKPESATEIIEPLDYDVTPGKRKSKPDRRNSGFYLPLWSVALMLLVVFGVAGGLIILVIALGGPKNVSGGEPVIIVLTAAPFETPSLPQITQAAPTLIPNVAATSAPAGSVVLSGPTLAPTLTFTPTQAAIAVGMQVIVVGAGGVNVRAAPGLESPVLFSANRNERFMVINGPRDAGDLTWWEIRDPLDTSRTGWAAGGDNSQDLLQVYVP